LQVFRAPVSAGDVVMPDEVLALIETDKVTIDVRYTGSKPAVLKTLSISPEDTVTVGQTVATYDDDPAAVESAGGASSTDTSSKPVR
jgi:2-oxoglutarate dehydrogenase E2 component (dihydrolipoamide succinyltransferase)